jgi:hypothetical protein
MAESPFRTPVLLIIFNRVETTKLVFEAIRKARPPRLYVAADGPRPGIESDKIKCVEARKIVEAVDWPCEIKTLFHNQNLNCGKGPSTAISWFFEHEAEGIILEDDCLPSGSFFQFCENLLERYRGDNRVMHIGGNNFLGGWQNDPDYSYYFSRSGHIWGWATWRRAWQTFDLDMMLYKTIRKKGFFDNFFLNRLEKFYRLRKFDKTVEKRGKVDWWDYQWDFARFINSGLSVVPRKNLVKNLGFGEDATHTLKGPSNLTSMEAMELDFPLTHPPFVVRDTESDRKYFYKFMRNIVLAKLNFW